MLYKSFPAEYNVKSDGRTIEGYASTFGPPKDLVGDIIDAGAFKKTIREGGPPKGKRIKMLWMHRSPLGMPVKMAEDSTGLHVEGRVTRTGFGSDCLAYVADGVVDRLSIGYNIVKDRYDKETETRHLKELILNEFSPVIFPANPRAAILGLKSMEMGEFHGNTEQLENLFKFVEIFGRDLDDLLIDEQVKSVVAFKDFPLASRTRAWDRRAADQRVRAWAGATEGPNERYRSAFVWYDRENADKFGAYKLQIADVVDGQLQAIPRAVFASAGVLQGARGGVNIPSGDVAGVQRHLARYYAKMRRAWDDDDIKPPWEKGGASLEEIEALVEALSLTDVDNKEALPPEESNPSTPASAEEPPKEHVEEPDTPTPDEDSTTKDSVNQEVILSLSRKAEKVIQALKGGK